LGRREAIPADERDEREQNGRNSMIFACLFVPSIVVLVLGQSRWKEVEHEHDNEYEHDGGARPDTLLSYSGLYYISIKAFVTIKYPDRLRVNYLRRSDSGAKLDQ
jgi:hypothetical protein